MISEKPSLKKLRFFYETFQSGPIAEVGEAEKKLDVTASWITRQIAELEKDIGEKLVNRDGQRLTLNSKGKGFLKAVEKIIIQYDQAFSELGNSSNTAEGQFTISFPSFLNSGTFFKDIAPLLQMYPNLNLSFKETNEAPNLNVGESDIDIRPLTKKVNGIDQKYLATYDIGMYASHSYLQQYGFLKGIDDFKDHHLIALSEECLFPYASLNWHITPITDCKKLILIDSTTAISQAIESGLGIGPMSHAAAAMSQTPLTLILPEFLIQSIDIYYMFLTPLSDTKFVTELYNYLREQPGGPLKGRIRR